MSQKVEQPNTSTEQNKNNGRERILEFIDKIDEKTPILGRIAPILKELKKFFTETLGGLFGDTRKKLSALQDQVDKVVQGVAGGKYTTTKSLQEEGVKLMKDLDFTESQKLAEKVFGNGFATDLLSKLDGGTGTMIQRMIALGQHEGGLKFGRQNPDPASGFNIGTFQIGGAGSTKESSLKKYKECYEAGVKLAQENGISAESYEKASPAQRDLLAHLGYIQSQRGGAETFAKLRDPKLPDNQVVTLMHKTIQGGIRAIGESVVAQVKSNRIDTTELA